MLKIYCALSAECAPERVHSTEVPNAALASCVVLIPQPFREERCAPRQSNLGKVISLVRPLLIRAHGNPQLSLSIF